MTLIFFALTCAVPVKIFERLIIFFAAAISVGAFFFVHYLKWSPVGGELVGGVQGRYFIPLALMVAAAMSFLPAMHHKNSIALLAALFAGVTTLLANFFAFY